MDANSFIFEDSSSSFMCCDAVTAQCSKEPQQRFTKTTRRASDYSSLPSSDVVNKKKKDIDQYLATTMKSLSIQERNAALEEVNGIVDNELEKVFEVPAILDEKLFELDQHLLSIKSGTVYETAECANPDYVQDQKFRLMFLRGRRYDAKLAAEQMLDFFESKLMLFGKDKLCKDITLDDLDEDERVAIRKGGLQLVEKDVGGRMICTNFRGMVKQKSILNELRTKYYTFMTMLESEAIQKKGAIGIMYVVGDRYKDKKGGSAMAKMGKLVRSMPIHWAGFHFCCDDTVQFVLIQALILAFPKHLAAKFRCHKGTHQECMYSMRAYGIPPSAVPIPETDDSKPPLLYKHLIWYQKREKVDREKEQGNAQERLRQEEPTTTANIIPLDEDEFSLEDPIPEQDDAYGEQLQQADEPPRDESAGSPHLIPPGSQSPTHRSVHRDTAPNTAITPRRTDVLFGPKFKNHPGTLELQKVVSKELAVFESIMHRTDKTKFVESLVEHLKASGIRFLDFHKETNSWIEVDHKVTRNKVAKIFRNKRRTTGLGPSFFGSMAKVSTDAMKS